MGPRSDQSCASDVEPIVVTGVGLLTPLGLGAAATWRALLGGRSLSTTGRIACTPAGTEGPCFARSAAPAAPDRVSQIALFAAREALAESRWDPAGRDPRHTALVVGTSKGAIDEWLDAIERSVGNPAPPVFADPRDATGSRGLHTLADDLAAATGLATGPRPTVSAACASGLYALAHAALLLRHGTADRALVVAAESSLHPLVLQSYRRIGVLAGDGTPTRPFDVRRAGFQVSEAAAAVCLERRPARPGEVTLAAFALAADATHLTGIHPQALALRHCLATVAAGHEHDIDLVHAHATGTEMNDPLELSAIESVAGTAPAGGPSSSVYSHKGAIGHTMGASGLISVVLNVLMHRAGAVLPNVNTSDPIPHTRVRIARDPTTRPVRRSLALAAGFGGPTAAALLRTA